MSRLTEFLKLQSTIPGRTRALQLDDGQVAQILVDPEHAPRESRYGAMMAVQVMREAAGGAVYWEPCTLYVRNADIAQIADLCGDGRAVLSVTCERVPLTDADGNPKMAKRGGVAYSTEWSFALYASKATALESLGVPDRVLQAPASGARVKKELPKPID